MSSAGGAIRGSGGSGGLGSAREGSGRVRENIKRSSGLAAAPTSEACSC